MPLSLFDVLADVPDPRRRPGRRYPLPVLLALLSLGLLMGRKSLTALRRLHRD
jgi:hypothetical protein